MTSIQNKKYKKLRFQCTHTHLFAQKIYIKKHKCFYFVRLVGAIQPAFGIIITIHKTTNNSQQLTVKQLNAFKHFLKKIKLKLIFYKLTGYS